MIIITTKFHLVEAIRHLLPRHVFKKPLPCSLRAEKSCHWLKRLCCLLTLIPEYQPEHSRFTCLGKITIYFKLWVSDLKILKSENGTLGRQRFYNIGTFCTSWGFPGSTIVKEPICQCKTHKRWKFDPWVEKIPWRRTWQPTPVFLPGELWWCQWTMVSQRVRHAWVTKLKGEEG